MSARIVAGQLGGRRIATPPGSGTRPTSDRVREAVFSTLSTLVGLAGCRFADLFAGSGAVGLEAASRGAEHVLLVEHDPRAARVIRENIAALGLGARCQLRATSVAAAVQAEGAFDVVFLDPPYALAEEPLATLLAALTGGFLAPGGLVVVERSTRSPEPSWPGPLTLERGRTYGETAVWYATG